MRNLACSALDKVTLGIIVVDEKLNITIWNRWLVRWTGHKAEAMIGRNLLTVYPQFAAKTYLDILHKALNNGQSRFCSGALHKISIPPADEEAQINVRQNMLFEPIDDGGQKFVLIQITDISSHYARVKQLKNTIKELGLEYEQVKASEVAIRHQALHDSLTGLPNRSLFIDRIENTIHISQRNNELFAVMFADLDGFKEINDHYGHEAGDVALQTMATRIARLLRKSDTLSRIGGDEFMMLLPRIKNKNDVMIVAEKIINDFHQPFSIQGNDIYLSVSLGISIFPEHGKDARTLIKNADMAMYNVKSMGKNNYSFFQN